MFKKAKQMEMTRTKEQLLDTAVSTACGTTKLVC